MRLIKALLPFISIVEKFVLDKCQKYQIDYSHDIHHSQQVAKLGFYIAEHDYYLSSKQKEVLYLSCMLHDMCDAKYTPVPQSIMDISQFLKEECRLTMTAHDGVMNIITSMSYSHVVQPDGTVCFPDYWLSHEPNFRDVYHITREADLLTSYDLKRMVHYKHEKLGLLYSCDIYRDIIDTVGTRMSKLLEKDLFVSPTAKKIAKRWHHELCDVVMPALTEDDIYTILNQPVPSQQVVLIC